MRKLLGGLAVAALVVGGAVLVLDHGDDGPAAPQQNDLSSSVASGEQAALQRDLGLTPQAATERLRTDAAAAAVQRGLGASLGRTFAGAYIAAGTDRLTVGITDQGQAAAVRAAGAIPKVVRHSQDELRATQSALDGRAATGRRVTSSYVDPVTNQVVLTVAPGTDAAALVKAAGVPAEQVRIEESAEVPRTFLNGYGGDAFYVGDGRCSIGFGVRTSTGVRGFVTAGHCRIGTDVKSKQMLPAGTFTSGQFPTDDFALVTTNSNLTVLPQVWSTGPVLVRGSTPAVVGASVCRSGSTTGWHCGVVQALNSTVNYPQGTVYEMTRTNVCAEPGDSGGSFISGNQAQGVTSGGSGNCSSGGTTYFQPLAEILTATGSTLVTG